MEQAYLLRLLVFTAAAFVAFRCQLVFGLSSELATKYLKFKDVDISAKDFLNKEPAFTPKKVIEFMDSLSDKSFAILDMIDTLVGKRTFNSESKPHETSLAEAVALSLKRYSDSSTLKSAKLSNKSFDSVWRREIERPCGRIQKTAFKYEERLPNFYNIEQLRYTRVGALLRFEELCRNLRSKTLAMEVLKVLQGISVRELSRE